MYDSKMKGTAHLCLITAVIKLCATLQPIRRDTVLYIG
jgi:hypothetical protein